jgi:protein SCO1/2
VHGTVEVMNRLAPLIVGLALLAAACRPADTAKRYELSGQILAVRPATREVLIKHGDIPGFMPAMTMTYTVDDAALLDGRAPGDLVTATLVVAGGDAPASHLEALRQTGTAPLPAAPAAIPAAAGVTILTTGDAVPATALTDQDGRRFSLADWKGHPVALTFIYTRCPLPEVCPLLDRRFAAVQKAAADDPTLRGQVRLLSVSFDPDADTPAVLKAHAATLGADPSTWVFATAPREVVDRFSAEFGVNVIREDDATITHSMRTLVIGRDGRIAAAHAGMQWTPEELLAELRAAAADR